MRDEILAAWERVYDSGQFILGPELKAFEAEFAAYLGVNYVVGVSSGTDALALILKAKGITGEVLVPALTFVGTAEAVLHAGATPVFTDVDPETWLMTSETAEAQWTPQTRAIIPVHLFGNPAPPPRFGVLSIEDACQAAGSSYMGQMCGSLGDAAAFSFYPSKTLPGCGDGGAVATDDPDIAERVRLLRHHGLPGAGTFRLDEIQAATLRIRLRELDEQVEVQRRRAHLSDQRETPGGRSSWHLIVKTGDRPAGARTYYDPPLHQQMPDYWRCELPVAERFARENWLCGSSRF